MWVTFVPKAANILWWSHDNQIPSASTFEHWLWYSILSYKHHQFDSSILTYLYICTFNDIVMLECTLGFIISLVYSRCGWTKVLVETWATVEVDLAVVVVVDLAVEVVGKYRWIYPLDQSTVWSVHCILRCSWYNQTLKTVILLQWRLCNVQKDVNV